MERLLLALNGVVFALFGAAMLVQPAELLAGAGIEVAGRHGVFEMRGIYGGVSLGVASACLIALARPALRGAALLALLVYCGGYVFARIVGVALDGPPEPGFFVYIGWELFVTAASALLLARRDGETGDVR